MTASTEYAATRKALRTQINSMPDGPIKLRTRHMDKNLQLLAKDPNDTAAPKALKDNMAELDKLKSAIPSEE